MKNGHLYRLSPFLDAQKILRVGGRLRLANIALECRQPVLLPKDCHISTLIVKYIHDKSHHCGRHTTFAAIRSAGKWIVGAHSLVRSVINRCITCKRIRGKLQTQIMADLPEDRLNPSPPFTNVGVDVFGPWTITTKKTKDGTINSKRWAVIFTWLCVRAVHIE